MASGQKSGVEVDRTRKGVTLLMIERLGTSVIGKVEVSFDLMRVKVKLGSERWVFAKAYGPGSKKRASARKSESEVILV